jgi:hypothetical protein
MSKPSSGKSVSIAIAAVTVVFSAVAGLAYFQGWIHINSPASRSAEEQLKSDQQKVASEEITFICDANYSMPVNGLDAPTKAYKEMLAAGLDYKNMVGWYQGNFSISESRKGVMVVKGSKAIVSRPAMFERFGTMVTSEQFTLDRETGEFVESLTFKDGRKVDIIKGYCGKLTKAPY